VLCIYSILHWRTATSCRHMRLLNFALVHCFLRRPTRLLNFALAHCYVTQAHAFTQFCTGALLLMQAHVFTQFCTGALLPHAGTCVYSILLWRTATSRRHMCLLNFALVHCFLMQVLNFGKGSEKRKAQGASLMDLVKKKSPREGEAYGT
jgi:hypothetical protein